MEKKVKEVSYNIAALMSHSTKTLESTPGIKPTKGTLLSFWVLHVLCVGLYWVLLFPSTVQ